MAQEGLDGGVDPFSPRGDGAEDAGGDESSAASAQPVADAESRGAASEGEPLAPPGLSVEPEPAAMDDLEPPDEAVPAFIVTAHKGRPPSVQFPDGTHVGVWLAERHPTWKPEHVLRNLLERGLDAEHAEAFARRRAMRDGATEALAAVIGPESMWAEFVRLEGERSKKLEPVRAAFLAAQKKK